ncbi:MAG: TIR domain-containing protein (plasmid) [Candidatus Methanoperedens sp.]|nr:MAG: TIR domain-containing protein [Candidatus Methanoperedens sp.]WAH95146.1 MAG: TIR domain-containing protein [Candidatus Methanoperedens sp.]WAM22294.1 MAG: TIR domain-containing protein [Candidatus Methanoperedens sp.]
MIVMKDDDIISTTNLYNRKDHENAIRTLFRHPDFPCMMSTDGLIVKNPIYKNLDRDIIEKIRSDYGPNGINNFKIMPLDIFLIKGLDENNQPMLLCYWSGKPKSGWKSYLMMFRDSNKEKNVAERIKNHEKDIETFIHRTQKTVTVKKRPDTNYLVSFKIDQGYKDLVAYIFTFCDVIISGDNNDIARRGEFQFNEGTYARKFKWYYPEGMEKDQRMMEVDGDVVSYIHTTFETMLTDIALSITNPILFEYDVALSFAGEDRKYSEELAKLLTEKGIKVFYDDYKTAELWGKNLYQHFQSIYRDNARFCVVFVSHNYAEKFWPRHELEQAQARAFRENEEYILPVRIDNTEIPGINDTRGYIDLRTTAMKDIAEAVITKLSRKT